MRRTRRAFGRSFAEINPVYARILGQPRVGGWSALGLVGSGLSFVSRGAWRQENEGRGEGQGRKGMVGVLRRGGRRSRSRGSRLAQSQWPTTVCVAGSEGGGEEQGKQSTGKKKKRKKESLGGCSRVPRLPFCPRFLFFWIQFYHKTSTYCINNRTPEPLIINRIPKYNRWSAHWRFYYIKDRFSKL